MVVALEILNLKRESMRLLADLDKTKCNCRLCVSDCHVLQVTVFHVRQHFQTYAYVTNINVKR